jgi:hypothetical protein
MAKKLRRDQEKAMFSKAQAKRMVSKAGFSVESIDVTPTEYRFRQREPSEFKKKSFRRIDIGRPGGIEAVIAKPKGMNKTRIQTVIVKKRQ